MLYHIKPGSQWFGRSRKIWNSSMFTNKTKVRLFNSLVKPEVMHSCETLKMDGGDKRSSMYSRLCLRRIFKIYWSYITSNEDLLKNSQSTRKRNQTHDEPLPLPIPKWQNSFKLPESRPRLPAKSN